MIIALVGYRGTGKTTVARALSERTGLAWLDTDVEIEETAGCSIASIFQSEGENGFRDRESRVVADLTARDNLILALGGGAVLRPKNRKLLQKRTRVVWLQADPQTIHLRLQADPTTASRRPALTALSDLDEIKRMLNQREPLYQQLAELAIGTDNAPPKEIAAEIADSLQIPQP